MATTDERLAGGVGNSPSQYCPHAETVPSVLSARLCHAPAEIATTFDRFGTSTGVELNVVLVVIPNWPAWLSPHARTVPSNRSVRVCSPPAEIATGYLSSTQLSIGPATASAKVTRATLALLPALACTKVTAASGRRHAAPATP